MKLVVVSNVDGSVTATFSGAFSASYSPCAVAITYSASSGYGSGHTYGSASIDITSLGPSMDLGNGNLSYQSPHGTRTGTLVDQNPMTAMASVMETVTF